VEVWNGTQSKEFCFKEVLWYFSIGKNQNKWTFRNKISGFDYSSKYFEIVNNNEIYVSHEYKGFRLQLDNKLNVTSFALWKAKEGKNASLIKFNDKIYYAYKEGVLKLNEKRSNLKKDKLSAFWKDEYTSGKLIVDNPIKSGCFRRIIFILF
jgi:hypothetical protein